MSSNIKKAKKPNKPVPATKKSTVMVVRSPKPNVRNTESSLAGIGAVVRTVMPRIGATDIRSHRVSWILGYTTTGNGTNGATNAVLFRTAGLTYFLGGLTGTAGTNGSGGGIPVLGGDTQLGSSYVSDVEKHYSRKVIKRAWIHVASLQPSTSNNMMCVVAASRGPGVAEYGIANLVAGAVPAQTFTNVMSMSNAITVDSFETKSMEVTHLIAGGSGTKQNEFEIQQPLNAAGTVLVSGASPTTPLLGLVPFSLVVSGNSTTAALQATLVHAIIVEQEVDLLDFIGGSNIAEPVG